MPKINYINVLKLSDGFTITPSDTVNVVSDPNNVNLYGHVFLHNVAAGATVRVLPADAPDTQTPITIYIPQGGISDLAVKRIYNTTPTPPAGLVGLVGRQLA